MHGLLLALLIMLPVLVALLACLGAVIWFTRLRRRERAERAVRPFVFMGYDVLQRLTRTGITDHDMSTPLRAYVVPYSTPGPHSNATLTTVITTAARALNCPHAAMIEDAILTRADVTSPRIIKRVAPYVQGEALYVQTMRWENRYYASVVDTACLPSVWPSNDWSNRHTMYAPLEVVVGAPCFGDAKDAQHRD